MSVCNLQLKHSVWNEDEVFISSRLHVWFDHPDPHRHVSLSRLPHRWRITHLPSLPRCTLRSSDLGRPCWLIFALEFTAQPGFATVNMGLDAQLSLDNRAVKAYVFYGSVLVLKCILMSFWTARHRIGKKVCSFVLPALFSLVTRGGGVLAANIDQFVGVLYSLQFCIVYKLQLVLKYTCYRWLSFPRDGEAAGGPLRDRRDVFCITLHLLIQTGSIAHSRMRKIRHSW